MPLPYRILPSVVVPAEVQEAVLAYDVSWSQREVVNIFRPNPYDSRRESMTPALCAFLDEVCLQRGIGKRNLQEDSLLLFGDVERHNDDGFYAGNLSKPGRFLQVVLQGEAELWFAGLRDRTMRCLPLQPGTVFVMNPKIHHEVRKATPRGVATLSAVVPYPL